MMEDESGKRQGRGGRGQEVALIQVASFDEADVTGSPTFAETAEESSITDQEAGGQDRTDPPPPTTTTITPPQAEGVLRADPELRDWPQAE